MNAKKFCNLTILILFVTALVLSGCVGISHRAGSACQDRGNIPKGSSKAGLIKFLKNNSFNVIADGTNVPRSRN